MKKKLIYIIFLFTCTIINSQEVKHNETVYYGKYLPKEISNIGFGLMADTFNNFMIENKIIHNSNKGKTAFVINAINKPYKNIFYEFDSNLKKLIEIELRFSTEVQATKYMLDNFNTKKEITKQEENVPYPMNAWQFRNKVFIVGKIPNSRWGN